MLALSTGYHPEGPESPSSLSRHLTSFHQVYLPLGPPSFPRPSHSCSLTPNAFNRPHASRGEDSSNLSKPSEPRLCSQDRRGPVLLCGESRKAGRAPRALSLRHSAETAASLALRSTQLMSLLSGMSGEGDGSPLQCSWLENPVDGGAWWAAVHGVGKVGHD